MIYNKIYAAIFNQTWVEQAHAKLRPYANNLKAWQASGYQDKSRLLQGQALQEEQNWAKDKQLSEADHQFLSTSREQALKAEMQANQVENTTAIHFGFAFVLWL
ncbi:WD-40 repeat protein [Beggiatoa sp. SS]|nr:WD-40 repeat protein [Beggiatoa sp. SS]